MELDYRKNALLFATRHGCTENVIYCVKEHDEELDIITTISRIAKEMGYRKVITYILESEPGISLKASNFVLEDEHCGGGNWTGKRKRQNNVTPEEYKQCWVKYLAA